MNFKNWLLNEMPLITLKGKTAYGDESPLKDINVETLSNNIVFFRQPEGNENSFIKPGSTWIYFMDSEKSAQDMKTGKIPMLMVPKGTFMTGGNPITDIWNKRFAKPGAEKILGVIEGHTDEDGIYIDMMTVRPKYKRNSITTKMIQYAQKEFPKAKVTFSSPTPQGEKFISSFEKTNESKFLIPELPKPARTAAQTLGAEPDYKPTDFKELESLEKTLQWAKDNISKILYLLLSKEPEKDIPASSEDVFNVSTYFKSVKKIRIGTINVFLNKKEKLYPLYAVASPYSAFYDTKEKSVFVDINSLISYDTKQLTQMIMHELTHVVDPKNYSKYRPSPSRSHRHLPLDSPLSYPRYIKDPLEFDAQGTEVYYLITSKLKHLNDKEAIELLNNIENWLRLGGKTPSIFNSLNLDQRFEIWKTKPTLWKRFKLRLYDLVKNLKGQYSK